MVVALPLYASGSPALSEWRPAALDHILVDMHQEVDASLIAFGRMVGNAFEDGREGAKDVSPIHTVATALGNL